MLVIVVALGAIAAASIYFAHHRKVLAVDHVSDRDNNLRDTYLKTLEHYLDPPGYGARFSFTAHSIHFPQPSELFSSIGHLVAQLKRVSRIQAEAPAQIAITSLFSRSMKPLRAALEKDRLIHEAPAIVGCRTASALALASEQD